MIQSAPDPTPVLMSADGSSVDLGTYDPIQAALMDEVCILVDREDRVTGKATKKICTYSLSSLH